MPEYKGSTISGSYFIGRVKHHRIRHYHNFPKHIEKNQVKSELLRIQTGIDTLQDEIQKVLMDSSISQLDKEILNTHLLILTDIEITQILQNSIANDLMSAPQAIETTFKKIIRNFSSMNNSYFAQRADDYKDVSNRLMVTVLGKDRKSSYRYNPDDIVFLHEITPSLVTTLSKSGVKAYCVGHGSYNSHSSILTRAFGMTALLCDEDVIKTARDNSIAILDAVSGSIYLDPEEDLVQHYSTILSRHTQMEKVLKTELNLPAVTLDGIAVGIKANIEYPGELNAVIDNLCEGIGLFRTEFIYLNRNTMPEEEEQYNIYSEVLKGLNNLPVVIRTFDLGGDKLSFLQKYNKEENPYLGSRGIRFSLQEKELFKHQIRAILRASIHGKASIMFPMIISSEDFLSGRTLVDECKTELDSERIPYDKSVQVGAMIETPAAALCSEQLVKVCDFFSFGTNDLVQYTLAVDRNNDQVAPYYVQHHPAVLALIKQTISVARNAGIPVSICGEMASNPCYIPLLIGLGITELSINPLRAAEVKAVVRRCDHKLREIVSNFNFNTELAQIEHLIRHTLKPYYSFDNK
jgi:phosphotransferase system enzyme I (PtsI)